MDIGIQELAAVAGVTSRTLRHYDDIGLLPAHRAPNGYRGYRQEDLVRLQRILLLRDMGLSLERIGQVLSGRTDDVVALREHLVALQQREQQLQRQMRAVRRTIHAIERNEDMDAQQMFDGFDHEQYRDEVVERWGQSAYDESARWWDGLGDSGQEAFLAESRALARDWQAAQESGIPVGDPQVQDLAARHVAWVQQGWGGRRPSPEAITGLAQMYVDDERFAANYGGREGAVFVRDALIEWTRRGGQ